MTATTRLRVAMLAAALVLVTGVLMLRTSEPSPPQVEPPTVAVRPERAEPASPSPPEASPVQREEVPEHRPQATAHSAATATAVNVLQPLTGHVRLDTGSPAVGATVRIACLTTTTDATGRFVMERRSIDDTDTLVATLAGYEPAVVDAVLRTPACRDSRDLDLVLPGPACGIDGWLVDRAGAPCQGWQLELFRGTGCGDLGFPNLFAEDLAAGATADNSGERQHAGQPTATANPNLQTLGADGVFRIGGLRRGRDYVLRAWHEGSLQSVLSAPVAAGSSNYVFTADLPACRERVWGRTEDRCGGPLAGVRVRLTMRVHQSAGCTSFATGQEVTTAADGSFELLQVPRQDLLLRFDGKGVDSLYHELHADDPGTGMRIQLSCTCRFRYETSVATAAVTELRLLDNDEKPLRLSMEMGAGDIMSTSAVAIENGRSPELEVSDAATWLELRAGDHVVARLPVRLDRGVTNVVR